MNFYESNVGRSISYKVATIDTPFIDRTGTVVSVGMDAIGNVTYMVDNGDVVYACQCQLTD